MQWLPSPDLIFSSAPHLPPHFLEKHSFLFTFFCFDLKVLDKTGRRKLQLELELEHLKRQTLVTSKMIFFMELVLSPGKSHGQRSLVGCSPWGLEDWTRLSDFTFTFHFHVLEKEMATHSSVLAWRIPGTGEPGGLPSLGSHRVRHD